MLIVELKQYTPWSSTFRFPQVFSPIIATGIQMNHIFSIIHIPLYISYFDWKKDEWYMFFNQATTPDNMHPLLAVETLKGADCVLWCHLVAYKVVDGVHVTHHTVGRKLITAVIMMTSSLPWNYPDIPLFCLYQMQANIIQAWNVLQYKSLTAMNKMCCNILN